VQGGVVREEDDLGLQLRLGGRADAGLERAKRVVDVRTSPMPERIAAIDAFVAAGYEVHVNFSPVALCVRKMISAFSCALAAGPMPASSARNSARQSSSEALLWRPDIQETKRSEGGMENLRYRTGWKGRWLSLGCQRKFTSCRAALCVRKMISAFSCALAAGPMPAPGDQALGGRDGEPALPHRLEGPLAVPVQGAAGRTRT
jgi:hypothetical protein